MPVDVQTVARNLRAQRDAREAAARARADVLRARLPEAAAILRAAGASAVWLFGSLARDEPGLGSDVDLAVQGMPRAAYIEALTRVSDMLGVVDLVRLEEASESLRARVRAEGIAL